MKQKINHEFLRVLKHQLKGPLTLMRGYLSFWDTDAYLKFSPEKQRDFIQKASTASKNLDALIEDSFLTLMIDLNTIRPHREKIEVQKTLSECLQELSPVLSNATPLRLDYVPPQDAIFSRSDPAYLKIALRKIIEYFLPHIPKGTLQITLKPDTKYTILEISTPDFGLTPEQQVKCFTKFFEGGLNLYIARQLILLLKGTAVWRSPSEHASLIRIQFPRT